MCVSKPQIYSSEEEDDDELEKYLFARGLCSCEETQTSFWQSVPCGQSLVVMQPSR